METDAAETQTADAVRADGKSCQKEGCNIRKIQVKHLQQTGHHQSREQCDGNIYQIYHEDTFDFLPFKYGHTAARSMTAADTCPIPTR